MKQHRVCLCAFFVCLLAALGAGLAPTAMAAEEEEPDRVLNIWKSSGEDTGKIPLAEIQIEIYQAATMEELAEGALTLSPVPTQEELERFQTPDRLAAVLTTDAQGFATYNFTEHGRPDGVYLIAERFSPATEAVVEPFYISFPTAEGAYTVNVTLKSSLEAGPGLNQDVCAIDNDSGSFAVGQLHTWILRGGVPDGLATAKSYVLTDLLDPRLTMESGSSILVLHTRDGAQKPLEPRDHYELEEGKNSVNGQRLRLSLTPAGMAYVASNLGSGSYTPELRFSFRAYINNTASMGSPIPATAHLTYVNASGIAYDADADHPEVHTGGFHLLVTDGVHEPLAGARFRLARLATEAEIRDERTATEELYIDGIKEQVVFVSFFRDRQMQGEKSKELKSGPEGKALAYGLPYGRYYLVETDAPEGYNRVTVPIPLAVNEMSHLAAEDGWLDVEDNTVDRTVTLINTKFVLPETGGMGSAMFALIGLCMIGSACTMLLRFRRRA